MTAARAQLGLGTAGIGNLYRPVSEAAATATVEAALGCGIALFDTAPHYGFGLAERRLGAVLAQSAQGRAAQVSTKVGRLLDPVTTLASAACTAAGERHGFVDADPFEPRFDYGADAILRSAEESLARLQRDRVAVLLAHDLGARTHGSAHQRHMRDFLDSGYRAMRDLRDAGTAARIGIGVNEVEVCLDLLERVELDVILLAGRYTLLEQGALDRLLPLCQARGTAVFIGGPFNSGILASDAPGGPYDYAAAPAGIVARTEQLRGACKAHGASLRGAALAFPAAHPVVEAVIAGMVGRGEVAEAVGHWHSPPAAGLWLQLRAQGLISAHAPLPVSADLP